MESTHYVAIFGGAVAGSEAAFQLSSKNVKVVVFEQNTLPYGKLESGLPKWHHKLRDRQENMIDERLDNPLIKFVPQARLGKDLDIRELKEKWGFSATMLATGAWKDRPLPVPGIDDYIGKGFYYQNALCEWFNNNHDPKFTKYDYQIPDGSIVIGGGLASIDIAKITMIESVRAKLSQRNIEVDALTLEKKGVIPYLAEIDLSLEKLGMKGSILYTRHLIEEMPVTPLPDDPTPEELQKAGATRRKLVDKVVERFGFQIQENRIAVQTIVKDGQLTGLVFEEDQQTGSEKLREEVHVPLVISAIGSIPEPIPGLGLSGEIYDVKDLESGELLDLPNTYVLGNALTGRGNIKHSQSHSRQITENIATAFIAVDEEMYEQIFDSAAEKSIKRIETIFTAIQGTDKCTPSQIEAIEAKVSELQDRAGYDGDIKNWIEKHRPVRLEDMVEE